MALTWRYGYRVLDWIIYERKTYTSLVYIIKLKVCVTFSGKIRTYRRVSVTDCVAAVTATSQTRRDALTHQTPFKKRRYVAFPRASLKYSLQKMLSYG